MAAGKKVLAWEQSEKKRKNFKFNMLITGVGGEGVLLTSVIVARAANLEGYEVRGTQVHGLAQRGGSIPVHMRFGKNLHSPLIGRGETDLMFGLEPIETIRYCYFASRQRTNFLVDNYQLIPLNAKMAGASYPSVGEIKNMLGPFAKSLKMINASNICIQKWGNPLFGNIMTLGAAMHLKLLPLREKSIIKALEITVPRDFENNMEALNLGLNLAKDAVVE